MVASSMKMRDSSTLGPQLHLVHSQANNSLRSASGAELGCCGGLSVHGLINAWVKLYFAKDEAGLKKFGEETLQTALGQLEKKLESRGGQYFVGNNLTWADTHVFMYLGDLPKEAYANY